jgi:hypothetical protein
MKLLSVGVMSLLLLFCVAAPAQNLFDELDKNYLSWSQKQTSQIGQIWREKGRIGGFFDNRIISTDKAYNYKLRATLMSPEAIRATVRHEQIRNGLTDAETRRLVNEAEKEKILVVLVEIDPREGSGVIPTDWRVAIQPKGSGENSSQRIRGVKNQALRDITAFKGISARDYDYDVFWVAFPLKDDKGSSLWANVPAEIELVVGIYNKEGRVNWKVSEPLRLRIENLLKN